ncbi:AbrB/MazE/SpoVT family DNA-binding domain-containing protein [Oceanobacillus alkalisoli]|uniref:AbrB/MazE/SpoVT family DNA-binding domain-containing protein n=1 Tax=Oceanobacillus alkalisoli TaxID=2925113 RepID=UPI001F11C1F2|nr:AbrB/MazE/SpoVT family DNA-binding domain-containing protein [Oceanobacillus alkalisoli]MCF3944862.1 AbrB/MazE/SpoVT family DNA-binding domain-containing protein [Oceanobacillus alkalisoli]
MGKNYSISEESHQEKVKNTTCILSTEYKITIPKLIRETLNLVNGDEVIISLISKKLTIRKLYEDTAENKMVLNDRGAVQIPQEFIKLQSLEKGDVFNVYLADSSIILRKKTND